MNILLTNTTLCNFYGSQVFTYTLALELKRQGHNVYCFTSKLGKVADLLVENKIPVTDDITDIPRNIDIIHAHHRHETLLAFAGYQKTPMVMVCHGVLPWQEQPYKRRLNICRYVAVSEEVQDHLVEHHGIPSLKISVIRNGIDFSRFYPKKPINKTLQHLLVLSNHSAGEQLEIVLQACKEKNVACTKIGFPAENVKNVEEYINDADMVVTLGRGVLEAAACKRVVVVYDYNGADGLVTKETFPIFCQKSFSGRTNHLHYSVEDFKAVLDSYNPNIAEDVFPLIAQFNITSIAQQYVALYQDAIKAFDETPDYSSDIFFCIKELMSDFKAQLSAAEANSRSAIAKIDHLSAELVKKQKALDEVVSEPKGQKEEEMTNG